MGSNEPTTRRLIKLPWVIGCVGGVVLAAALLYVGMNLFATAIWEGLKGNGPEHQRANAYVSDNPGLTTNREIGLSVTAAFRTSAGIPPAGARDVRAAFRPYILVMRFRLDRAHLARFLRGKRVGERSAAGIYRRLDDEEEGNSLAFPFFSRLTWWPIPLERTANFQDYIGICWYDTEWFLKGNDYTILADRHSGVVYIVAFTTD